jgi:predicted dienelactone hydrolase
MRTIVSAGALLAVAVAVPATAENRIDGQSPDAPSLSAYGPRAVGVRQFDFVNPDQIDVVNIDASADPAAPLPRYDRPLRVEMWYPAVDGATGDTTLDAYIRDGATQVKLRGRAVRDAAPSASAGPSPLVLLSHGYPGNRFLMSHLAENLASKGYVVASIDHTDSTYRTQDAFASTLRNRPLDQLFVLDEIARLNADPSSDLSGLIDTDNAGLIGYSMGGYGAVITAGGGLTETVVDNAFTSPRGVLGIHEAGSATHEALPDQRIKTAIAIGPWGRQDTFAGAFWDAEGLAGIEIPMLFIGGSDDQVSMYEDGIRRIWEEATGVDRSLLTFEDGSHNTAAPIPAPSEAFAAGVASHYVDDDWDTVFMNNVAQHFATAWLDAALKDDLGKMDFLDVARNGEAGWKGFAEGTADRLRFETLAAGQTPAPIPLPASAWLLAAAVAGLGAMRRARRPAAG